MATALTVVIEPTAGAPLPRLTEAWHNRELLYFLTLRDVKVRYAQTVLGWLWAIAQPVGMTLVFTLAFSRLGKVQTDGVKYPVFAFVGLTFWTFFSRAVQGASESLVTNTPLITKTACPRLLLPLSAITSALFDLVIALAMMFIVLLIYGQSLNWRLVFFPAVILLGVTLAVGLGVILTSVNVRHRDVRNALPFAMQLLLFLSPIAYSLSSLAGSFIWINPLVGIVEAFRWSVIGTPAPTMIALLWAIGISIVLLVGGLVYFARVARDFADVA